MKHPLAMVVATLSIAASLSFAAVNDEGDVKPASFFPPPLADAWSTWIVGAWEGTGRSDTGSGRGVERVTFALNGQFLVSHGEAQITEVTAEQAAYLRRNMHASDEVIARFQSSPYRSLEVFTLDPATGDVVAYSFDSLRCIATGRGRRETNREVIDWIWTNGHTSTRITERIKEDHMTITQRTPMPDGSVLEEKGEAVRRPQSGPASAETPETATVRAFIAAINAHDADALATLMTEDHTFIDSGGTVVTGRDRMVSGWRSYYAVFPDYTIDVETIAQAGDLVTAFGSWNATYAPAGMLVPENRVGGPAAWKARVENSRIKTWQVYADHTRTFEVMQRAAARASPAP